MKQHPIPQNILDIEFKLFSKFTIKEFIYIAIGVGFGSIFLFMMSTGALPAIIALPLFILFSGTGLFLGLVKINDQKADVYLKNFIGAITTPTQRVWRNKEFDEKFAELSPSTVTKPGLPKSSNSNIVAGNTDVIAHNFADQNSISALDREEQDRLNNLVALDQQTISPTVQPTPITPSVQPATQQPLAAPTQVVPPIQAIIPQQVPIQTQIATPASSVPVTQPLTQPSIQQQIPAPTQIPTIQAQQAPQAQPTPQTQVSQQPQTISNLTIGSHNIQDYQLPIANIPQVPNTINMLLMDVNSKPVNKAIVMVKDSGGKIVNVKVSNQSGLVVTGKQFPSDKYLITIQAEGYTFPEITFILEGGVYPPIRIKAIK